MRWPTVTPVGWVAAALSVIGLTFLTIGLTTSKLDNWAPNIATEAFAIALTIAVVERIVRRTHEREEEQRIQPRRDRALHVLAFAFRKFAWFAQFDYACTHTSTNPEDLPTDPVEVLTLWQEQHGNEDGQRPGRVGWPLLIDHGVELVEKAQAVGATEREHLPADLVVALDNLSYIFGGHGEAFVEMVNRELPRQGLDDWLCLVMVSNARQFGEVLRRHVPNLFEEWEAEARARAQAS